MALNFPDNPNLGETYVLDSTTWQWNGTAWNIVESVSGRNIFTNFESDSGTASPDSIDDTLSIQGGANITTSVTDKILTISSSGTTQNLFATINSDDGNTTADAITDTLNILGGTNISTTIATDTDNLTINMDPFSINFLSDVDTTSNPPTTGQVLKWNGTNWTPGADIASGGSGLDADTLDGFDSAYFLNYNNFINTPAVATLSSFSIGNEPAASGNGAITYDNTTGVFRYTPPDLSSYLTSVAFSDITSKPTTLAGYGITDAALSSALPTSLTDLSIVDGALGQVLTTDGEGNFSFTSVGGAGGDYSDTDVDIHLNTSTASTNEILSWTGSDYDWIAQPAAGEANQNAFSNVLVAGQNIVTADSATDTLTLEAGSNITLTTTNNTVTITASTSSVSNFDDLGDVTTASLRIDQIYEPAIAMLRVDNVSASAYTFNSHYTGNNPTLYAISGTTLAFDLDAIPGHPFELQDNTLTALTENIVHVAPNGTVSTGSNAQGKDSGTLYWRIPEANPGTYVYQCQSHSSMFGNISVKDLSNL